MNSSDAAVGLQFLLFERGPLVLGSKTVAASSSSRVRAKRARATSLTATSMQVSSSYPSGDHPRLRKALARAAAAHGESWRLRRADGTTLEALLRHVDLAWAGRRVRLALVSGGEAVDRDYAAHGTPRSRKSPAARGRE